MTMFEKMKQHPDAPKRPVPAYLFFSQLMRPKLLASSPGLTQIETAKHLGRMWRNLPARVKAVYHAQEKLDRVRYHDMMARWTHLQMQLTSNGQANEPTSGG